MFGKQMLVIHILCKRTFRVWPCSTLHTILKENSFEIILILNISSDAWINFIRGIFSSLLNTRSLGVRNTSSGQTVKEHPAHIPLAQSSVRGLYRRCSVLHRFCPLPTLNDNPLNLSLTVFCATTNVLFHRGNVTNNKNHDALSKWSDALKDNKNLREHSLGYLFSCSPRRFYWRMAVRQSTCVHISHGCDVVWEPRRWTIWTSAGLT